SPDDSGPARAAPEAERARLEQALFARTARGDSAFQIEEAVPEVMARHSLDVSSYPQKIREFAVSREAALVPIGWAVLVLVLMAVAGTFLWSLLNRRFLLNWIVSFIILMILIALLLPSVQSAREAARRAVGLAAAARSEMAPL